MPICRRHARSTLVSCLLLFAAASEALAQGSDWPTFLGPLGTSVSTEKGIIAPWPEKGLRVVWHRELGTGYGAPTISKGKLYVFDRILNKARLQCLDARTGASHWTFTYPSFYRDHYNYNNGPRCAPVIDGDRVYLHGAEGMLHCISAADGKVLWKIDTKKDFGIVQNFFGVGSTPIVVGDLLLVMVGGSPPDSDPRDVMALKGNGSGVVAFDKRTGKIAWKVSDELASYSSPMLATIGGRRWCFVFARGGLLALNPANGKLDFRFPWRAEDLESVNASNPIVVGDRVLISETYGPGAALLQVRPGGYKVIWDDAKLPRKRLQCHWMTPIHHQGYVYGSSGRHKENAVLRCLELATGKVTWSEPRLTRMSLLMVDGHFIGLGEEGDLRLLKVNPTKYDEVSVMDAVRDPKTGARLLEYPCWAAPVLSHGLLYVRGDGRIVCMELIPKK